MSFRYQTCAGVTLIEVVIVGAVVAVLAAAGGMGLQSWFAGQRAKHAARQLADLVTLARVEAIRTRVNHLVFFQTDAGGNPLSEPTGNGVAALVVRDDDGDGAPDPGEFRSAVPFDPSGLLSWGVSVATVPAPGDPTPDGANPPPTPWTFRQPNGSDANWVVFLPDGTPRAFGIGGGFNNGPVASGDGAVYVSSAERDYALVVAPLGGVRVHAWDPAQSDWRR